MGDERGIYLTIPAKLLLTLSTLALVSVVTVAALSITSIVQTGQTAKDVGSSTLQCQIDNSLTQFIVSSANEIDLELEGVRRDVLVTDDNVVSLTYLEPEGQG